MPEVIYEDYYRAGCAMAQGAAAQAADYKEWMSLPATPGGPTRVADIMTLMMRTPGGAMPAPAGPPAGTRTVGAEV